jgi:hypothetical protein
MRWDGLFSDLEAQADRLDRSERAAEVDERARIEVAKVRLVDRLRPALGTPLRLRCGADVSVVGVLRQIGPDWALVDEGAGHEAVVILGAIVAISGLGRLSAPPDTASVVSSRLALGHVLRGIARDRSAVQVNLTDGSVVEGTIDRVGADFAELAVHAPGELRRRSEVREVLVLPMAGLVALRRNNG